MTITEYFPTRAEVRSKYPIDPHSIAGILLREFDQPHDAFRYASKMVAKLDAMGCSQHPMRWEYYDAAAIIQEHYQTQSATITGEP